jgi:putative transposase
VYHKTTDRHHCFTRHPNLLKAWPQQIRASEQLWVADIAYFPTHGKFICPSLVKDAYSRKIVGWHVHERLQTEEVAQAVKMALPVRRRRQQLVHPSDRGIQYYSTYYRACPSATA